MRVVVFRRKFFKVSPDLVALSLQGNSKVSVKIEPKSPSEPLTLLRITADKEKVLISEEEGPEGSIALLLRRAEKASAGFTTISCMVRSNRNEAMVAPIVVQLK